MSFTRRLRRNLEREGKLRREVIETRSRNKIMDFLDKYPKASITYVKVSSAGRRFWNARCVAWVAQ